LHDLLLLEYVLGYRVDIIKRKEHIPRLKVSMGDTIVM
jgi:hypothetical protein